MEFLADNWKYGVAILMSLVASIVMTQTPEVRKYRWLFFLTLVAFIAFIWISFRVNTIVGIMLLLLVTRPILWVCGLISYSVLGHHLATGVSNTIYGSSGPPDMELDIVLVTQLRTSRSFLKAVEHLNAVLHSRPDNFEARMLLASIHFEDLRDIATAEKHIREILAAPTIIPGWKQLAEDRLNLWKSGNRPGRPGKLVLKTSEALSTKPGELHPLELPPSKPVPAVAAKFRVESLSTVEDLAKAGYYGLAMEMVDDIVTKNPDDLCALALRALLCLKFLSQPNLAKRSIERILNTTTINDKQCDAVFALADWCATDPDYIRHAKRLVKRIATEAIIPEEKRQPALDRLAKWEGM